MFPFDLLVPRPPDRRGREPEVNAWIELHNLVLVAESLDDLGPEHIGRIRRQRGVDLRDRFPDERLALYQRALDWSLAETPFDAADRARLAALARVLHLPAGDREAAHQRAFGIAAHQAIADGHLSDDERLLLHKLQHTLGLDPDLAEGAFDVLAREWLLFTVARVLNDGLLSPEEAARIDEIQRSLSVTIPAPLQSHLAKATKRWQTRYGTPAEEVVVDGSEPVRHAWAARWRSALPSRLHAAFRKRDGRDVRDAGNTRRYVVPASALQGAAQTGRVFLTDRLLAFDAEGRPPRGYRLREVRRTRRFGNGVLIEVGTRALLVESENDEGLVRQIFRSARSTKTWTARWRPLRANERDAAFRRLKRMSTVARYQAALPRLRSGARQSDWSETGEVRLRKHTLRLSDGERTSTKTLRTPPEVYVHKRLVWMVRPNAQDTLFEFADEAEAQRFAKEFA